MYRFISIYIYIYMNMKRRGSIKFRFTIRKIFS